MDTRQHHSNDFLTLTPTGATSLVFSGLSRGGEGEGERSGEGRESVIFLVSSPRVFPVLSPDT